MIPCLVGCVAKGLFKKFLKRRAGNKSNKECDPIECPVCKRKIYREPEQNDAEFIERRMEVQLQGYVLKQVKPYFPNKKKISEIWKKNKGRK